MDVTMIIRMSIDGDWKLRRSNEYQALLYGMSNAIDEKNHVKK